MAIGTLHAARLDRSPRLQRVLALLRQRGSRGATTLEIVTEARVMAVNSVAAELRANGFLVTATPEGRTAEGSAVYRYRLHEGPAQQEIEGADVAAHERLDRRRPGEGTAAGRSRAGAPGRSRVGRVRFPLADRGLVGREPGSIPGDLSGGGDAAGNSAETNGPGGPPVNAPAESDAGATDQQLALFGA